MATARGIKKVEWKLIMEVDWLGESIANYGTLGEKVKVE